MVASGRVAGFENFKVDRAIDYDHVIDADDFPSSNEFYQAFRNYVAKDENFKGLLPTVDRNRQFVESQLRYNLAMAAYGTVTATQVLMRHDSQVAKAVEVLPRARDWRWPRCERAPRNVAQV